MSKQDRQGVRTPADLERKYGLGNLGKQFSEVMGVSTDAREAVDRIASELRSEFSEQVTSLTRDTERIVLAALESYTETSDFENFQQTVQSELLVMADKISMSFETATTQLADTNGELQSVVEFIQKHFDFTVDGLTIKADEYSMNLNLDNDEVYFSKNGQRFGVWDGVNFRTGNIYIGVEEVAQFGNYGFVPYEDDETDGLDLVRVGG